MVTRRTLLAAGAVAAGALAAPAIGASDDARFVRRVGTSLRLGNRPYRFVGANIWYGAYLGADAPFGDRDRLRRELDSIAALGITNLRVLASSELSPLR